MTKKVVAITGAYRGLGAALSNAFAKRGHTLVLGGRDGVELEKFVQKLGDPAHRVSVVMDVKKKEDCERFINTAVEKFGRLDLLVNNAGIWKMAGIEEVTEQDVYDIFETNTFGSIYCAQAAVRVMRKQGSGHILNIGSTAAVDYKTGHAAYGASKAAVIGFTGCLRTELERTGIRVSVFSPGGIKTELFRSRPERMREDFMDPDSVAEKIFEHIENPSEEWHVILRRPGK